MTWGFRLGNTYLSGGDNDTNLDNCANPPETVGCLSKPPKGLGIPGKRTEDTEYNQRDGVKHFNDWYIERLLTFDEVMVCNTTCGCGTPGNARAKARALDLDWRRSCCDIEGVIYTDCNGQYEEGEPILGQQLIRRNMVRNPSFETGIHLWTVPLDTYCRTYPRCYNPTWCYGETIGGVFTESHETDGGWIGDGYMRLTCEATPSGGGMGFTYDPPEIAEPAATVGDEWTASAYLRASGTHDVVAQILWYDDADNLIAVAPGGSVEVLAGSDWDDNIRVHVIATAPSGVAYGHPQWVTLTSDGWVTGGTLDIDGVLFEKTGVLRDYFDGDSPDVDDPPEVGGQVVINMWVGPEHNSVSLQGSQTYEEYLDRSLYGPYGVVGRPRVGDHDWLGQGSSCAEYLLRFDSPDQRLYVLDECGTPGYQQCRTVTPGLVQSCRTYPLCYSADGAEGRCYSENSTSLIVPVTVPVGGTEIIHPLLVLYPNLSFPTIENMNNSEFIRFNGAVRDEPIQIDTENGIATGLDTGEDYTHLLGGSIYMSMSPGNNQFRMYSNASSDDGQAAICWRDTVVSG